MREAVLQRALADLILRSTDADFRLDPAGFGISRGLARRDAGPFARQRDRYLLYRELARTNLLAPLENTYPVLRALLGAESWSEATAAFLQDRPLASPYYRDIAPAFAAWLAETGWGRERWPALLELAHYEWVELQITRWPDEAEATDLRDQPALEARLVLDTAARVVSYGHAVHRATEAEPSPRPEAVHLLLHRDAEGGFAVLELTGTTAALLASEEPLGAALASLGLGLDDSLRDLLADLQVRGALRGFRA